MQEPAIARVTGNEEDGWNVEVDDPGYKITFACGDKEDADELCLLLNDCSWLEIRRT